MAGKPLRAGPYALSNFEDLLPAADGKPWNCRGESARTLAAKKLNSINPKIKTLWYQPASNLRHLPRRAPPSAPGVVAAR